MGFIIFNVIVIALIIAWGAATSGKSGENALDLPTLLIGPVGTVFLLVLLIAGWVAWAILVTLRWRRRTRDLDR